MNFKETEINDTILSLRKSLYNELSAPIDGMWESLYIANATHYLIISEDEIKGYCCIDEDASLLQLYLIDSYKNKINAVIDELIQTKLIRKAKLCSSEAIAFNACLERSKTIEKDTINYHSTKDSLKNLKSSLSYRLAKSEDIESIKAFFKAEISFDDSFGYTENLVTRREIYLFEEDKKIIATGECRLSDTQKEFADIGMIVKISKRGQGLGAKVLNEMALKAIASDRKAICSTTMDNIASQKAIESIGFFQRDIYFKMVF